MTQNTGTTTSPDSTPGDAKWISRAKDDFELRQLARKLSDHCKAYRGADLKRGLIQLATTALPFFALAAAMFAGVTYELYWLTALLTLPAAGLLVRLFIIQHDCGHGSYFRSRAANNWLGRAISLFTLTPYSSWRRAHAVHHATSGNLNRRGTGDVGTLTVSEYLALPRLKRFGYRLYRHPLVHLVFGAPYYFILRQRIPLGWALPGRQVWRSILTLNLGIAALYGSAVLLFGWKPLLIVYLPVMVIASWIGGWMFFVQHQFEKTYWAPEEKWDFHVAAIMGSSYYVLPKILNWFTGNIGLHHIHHLSGSIPNYRLQDCLKASPELQRLSRLTLRDSLKCVRLALWDEDQGRLVGFRNLKGLPSAA